MQWTVLDAVGVENSSTEWMWMWEAADVGGVVFLRQPPRWEN